MTGVYYDSCLECNVLVLAILARMRLFFVLARSLVSLQGASHGGDRGTSLTTALAERYAAQSADGECSPRVDERDDDRVTTRLRPRLRQKGASSDDETRLRKVTPRWARCGEFTLTLALARAP